MHELSIAEALIEQAEREAKRAGQQGRIVRLELSVGRLSGVSCDSLRFAFELLVPGTRLEGGQLLIREPKALSVCRACKARVEIDQLVVQCPQCQSREIVIEGGRDLMLQSIEVTEEHAVS